jgi:hypothetical protein
VDIVWADVLRASLSFFLVIVGIGIAYVCFRLGGVLRKMSMTVVRMTDEVVPILSRAQTTVDGINLELQRVDEIMVSAVNATKGAEKTVTSISHAVTAPVKKATGWAAATREAVATFRAKRAESAPLGEPEAPTAAHTEPQDRVPAPPASPAQAVAVEPAGIRVSESTDGSGTSNGVAQDLPPEIRTRSRGPSVSQISWALPKRRT